MPGQLALRCLFCDLDGPDTDPAAARVFLLRHEKCLTTMDQQCMRIMAHCLSCR